MRVTIFFSLHCKMNFFEITTKSSTAKLMKALSIRSHTRLCKHVRQKLQLRHFPWDTSGSNIKLCTRHYQWPTSQNVGGPAFSRRSHYRTGKLCDGNGRGPGIHIGIWNKDRDCVGTQSRKNPNEEPYCRPALMNAGEALQCSVAVQHVCTRKVQTSPTFWYKSILSNDPIPKFSIPILVFDMVYCWLSASLCKDILQTNFNPRLSNFTLVAFAPQSLLWWVSSLPDRTVTTTQMGRKITSHQKSFH